MHLEKGGEEHDKIVCRFFKNSFFMSELHSIWSLFFIFNCFQCIEQNQCEDDGIENKFLFVFFSPFFCFVQSLNVALNTKRLNQKRFVLFRFMSIHFTSGNIRSYRFSSIHMWQIRCMGFVIKEKRTQCWCWSMCVWMHSIKIEQNNPMIH